MNGLNSFDKTDEEYSPAPTGLPKIEIHEIHKMYEIHCLKIEFHSNATLPKYRNPRNPVTVWNPHA